MGGGWMMEACLYVQFFFGTLVVRWCVEVGWCTDKPNCTFSLILPCGNCAHENRHLVYLKVQFH